MKVLLPTCELGTADTLAVSRVVLIVTSCPLKEAAALPTRSCSRAADSSAGAVLVTVTASPVETVGVGGPGSLLHPADFRRAAGRGDRHGGHRQWDYKVIPAERLGQALERASEMLGQLVAHLVLNGPDPDALPDRDFSATSWHCRSCPFLAVCLPGTAAEAGGEGDVAEDAEPAAPVTDEEAWNALHEYEEIQDTIREFEDEKRWVLEKLRAWLGQQGVVKAKLEGRENTRSVGMVTSRRYSVDYRRLNNLLDPDVRAEIVTESESEYLRVS